MNNQHNTHERERASIEYHIILYRLAYFTNIISFRLINPSKSDIAKISKSILDKINKAIVSTTSVNQWKNTSDVIKWFKSILDKRVSSFVNSDVENFYPSISMKLFTDSIKYAKYLIEITDQDLAITMQVKWSNG